MLGPMENVANHTQIPPIKPLSTTMCHLILGWGQVTTIPLSECKPLDKKGISIFSYPASLYTALPQVDSV